MTLSGGEAAKFRMVMEQHADAVTRYCLRRLPLHNVNDVVAEVFTVAWRKFDQMPDGDGTLPWLYGVARNEVLKARRSTGRTTRLREKLDAQPRYPDSGPETIVVRKAEAEAAMRALASLRPADQEVLLLRSHEGLSLSEIAVVLGCSVDAAKKRSARALNRLRKVLGVPGPDAGSSPGAVAEGGGGDR